MNRRAARIRGALNRVTDALVERTTAEFAALPDDDDLLDIDDHYYDRANDADTAALHDNRIED